MASPSHPSPKARKRPVVWLSLLLLLVGGIVHFSSFGNTVDTLTASSKRPHPQILPQTQPVPAKLFGKDVYTRNVSKLFQVESFLSQDGGTDRQLLPDRLITVFGLESSGTTFVTQTLARIFQASSKPVWGGGDKVYIHHETDPHNQTILNTTWIQHLSLPWGYFDQRTPTDQKVIQTIPLLPPLACAAWSPKRQILSQIEKSPALWTDPHPACAKLINDISSSSSRMLPPRFYVDIVSHIRRYRQAGVRATAVLVIRDDYAHFVSKVHHHQASVSKALEEDARGKQLLETAMQQLTPQEEVVVLSYETLMSIPKAYLSQICQQLGIDADYLSKANLLEFRNGNRQYIHPTTILDKKGQRWQHRDSNPPSRKQYKAALQQNQQLWEETGDPGGR